MKFDQDIIQRIKVSGILMLQIYKVLTGTMLTLFVPQACWITEDESISLQICTLTQNYENKDIYHMITMYWNLLSFLLFVGCYSLELRREMWAIRFLDINNNRPDNSLKQIIIYEPELNREMDKLNKMYFYGVLITSFAYLVNVSLMIRIVINDYHSMSTISCFISFVLLVNMKLYNSLSIAYSSLKSDKMMSAYMCEFVSYNVLDYDYLANKGLEDIGRVRP